VGTPVRKVVGAIVGCGTGCIVGPVRVNVCVHESGDNVQKKENMRLTKEKNDIAFDTFLPGVMQT
jgi:hypothetical protein